MKLKNPIKSLTGKERVLWIASLIIVSASNLFSGDISPLNLIAALIGVTAVLLGAKGNVWGQILIAVFSVLYGIISWQFHYWGEMVTYLGMTFPMALWSIYTWIKNPSEENADEVRISRLSLTQLVLVTIAGIFVTILFYFILRYFKTPNLTVGTISVTTSFFAVALSMLRSSYYAIWYAANDLVLIVLWVYASFTDLIYIPVVVNFIVFLVNDSYGFFSWRKRERLQKIVSSFL